MKKGATRALLAFLALAFAAGAWGQDPGTTGDTSPPSPTTPGSDPTPANASDASQAPGATPAATTGTIPVRTSDQEETPPAAGTVKLDEVTVTAQKVKQSARDVPISMSVMSDQFVAEHGISDIVQAMQYVPNVKIASAGFFAAPQARGFSFNNNNKAFESPLGIAFDGIPYTNTTYFNAALFDIERVEVMRGPQGTTFGKNTTAGLVSIVTAEPTSTLTGSTTLQFGDYGKRHYEAAIAGPIHDDFVEFRVALIKDDMGGFIKNTTAPLSAAAVPVMRGYRHDGYRAKLLFPDLFGTTFKLSVEDVSLDSIGAGIQVWEVSQPVETVIRKYDPNASVTLGSSYASEDGPDYRYASARTYVGEWTIPVGGWEITALGGWSQLKESLSIDVDFTPVPGLLGYGADRFPTTSFELRANAPSLDGLFGMHQLFGFNLGHTDFITGFFYQRRSIRDSNLLFAFNDGPLLELTGAAETPDQGTSTSSSGSTVGGTGANQAGSNSRQENFNQVYDQMGTALAVFQQTEWHFLPKWSALAGLRLSKETKTGIWNDVFEGATAADQSPSNNPVATALGLAPFSETRSLSETQLQPKVSLNYKPTEELSVFLHWTRGFKSGGFNAFAYRDVPEELVYKPETMTEWALDLKGSFLGGWLRPDLSIYRMDARNFQVLGREKPPAVGNSSGQTCVPAFSTSQCIPPSAVIGLGPTRVFNADKAYAQGAEGTLNWLAFGGLSVLTTVGYNDTKYVVFTQNECPATSTATYCDASGSPFSFAPRWDAAITPSWIVALPWGLTMTPNATAQYMSHQFLDTHLTHIQAGYMRYNAGLAIASLAKGWTLQVIGTNLGDKRTSIRYGDVLPHYEIAVPEPPRMIYSQFRYTFQ